MNRSLYVLHVCCMSMIKYNYTVCIWLTYKKFYLTSGKWAVMVNVYLQKYCKPQLHCYFKTKNTILDVNTFSPLHIKETKQNYIHSRTITSLYSIWLLFSFTYNKLLPQYINNLSSIILLIFNSTYVTFQ